jgi:hypothetical protein
MHPYELTTPQIIAIVVIGLIVLAAIIIAVKRSRSARLRRKFGEAEYDRTVAIRGNRDKAEDLLEERTERVRSFHLRELSVADRARFQEAWASVQARFVDGPAGAVTEADQLVGDLMATRGYPVSDFETRAADISVDHPLVVQNYRAGHDIAVHHLKGEATTEDLRRAMIHYRALFEDLVGEPKAPPATSSPAYQMPPPYRTR